jgi:hypothetical protein
MKARPGTPPLRLEWLQFRRFTDARERFRNAACIYVQADSEGRPIRVGKASKGLEARYRGGTGYALDAAMHGSDNLVFAAAVPAGMCEVVEHALIWDLRYKNLGKRTQPTRMVNITHTGTVSRFAALAQR